MLVWPFLFDSTFTLLRRSRARENIFTAHRSHLYQRLVKSGLSHAALSSLYTGLAVLGLACALITFSPLVVVALSPYVIIPIAALGLWRYVVKAEKNARCR